MSILIIVLCFIHTHVAEIESVDTRCVFNACCSQRNVSLSALHNANNIIITQRTDAWAFVRGKTRKFNNGFCYQLYTIHLVCSLIEYLYCFQQIKKTVSKIYNRNYVVTVRFSNFCDFFRKYSINPECQ